MQVAYLDPLIWVQPPWKHIARALGSTLQRAPGLLDAYLAIARSTGAIGHVSLHACSACKMGCRAARHAACAGSPGLVRALLGHAQQDPQRLAEQESALLAVLVEKVGGMPVQLPFEKGKQVRCKWGLEIRPCA